MRHSILICLLLFSNFLIAQPSSFNSRGIGGGGALFAPSINPANNDEYYIACDMSELFHSTDFGLTYSQVHFTELIGGHNSKVCYTNTTNLLYSISYINDIGTPVKSSDNGITWNTLAGNPDPSENTYTIHVDYANSNRIIISYFGAIHFSSNGGTTFTSIHTASTGSGNVVGGAFFDGNNIYIGTNDGVLISTNGGGTWSTATITGIPSTNRIWSFCGGKVGTTTRLFCLTAVAGDIYVGLQASDYTGFNKGIYSCDYGMGNWIAKNSGITANDYPMFIDMAENDINTVYIAGSNSINEPIVMKTINAGTGWTHTFITANNQNIITGWSGKGGDRGWSYGECPFGFDVASNNAQRVIFGDFGFVHATSNGGTSWKQAYVNASGQHPANTTTPVNQSYQSIGIENTTCWQVHWINSTNTWACFSDIRGIRSTDSGNSWSFNYTGHTANSSYRIAQHPTNGTLYMATSGVHDMYQSTRLTDALLDPNDSEGKIEYSINNGATWQLLHLFNHPVFWIALDPSNPNRAYASVIHYNAGAGVGGVYRCDNLQNLATSTWTLLPNPTGTEKHPASLIVLNDGKLVATYSGRRTTVFTPSSGCFIYDPVGNSWTDVSHSGMRYWTKDIVIDPNDATQNTWYVSVFSGWGGAANGLGGLYKTTNRGGAWTKLTGTTIGRATSCTFNPNNPNQIFITTEGQGLWMSNNINSGTPTFSMVNSYPFRQPERVFFNPNNISEMWVTSFGNGIKMGTLLTTGIVDFNNLSDLSIYPNPCEGLFTLNNKQETQAIIYNTLGEQIVVVKLTEGENKIDLSFLKSGIYFIQCGNKKGKILVDN
ncbi:MAG: T9SS type A sorting domain-containing protein [Bacteroidetes bacterium]|nr:T9SS type A sorting domain-containing protein [Bacteroidota bacterium]